MTSSPALPRETAEAAAALRAALGGEVLVAADPGYDQARQVWNAAVDHHPAVLVRCAGEKDVRAAVRIAREHGLPLSVRGGGHDWAGRALRQGGVVLDLSGLRQVTVDPATGTAEVQGGARAGDLIEEAARHGFAPVTGTVKAVGVTGLTLGGGYGLLAGAHGLASDNLVGAHVVLADGESVTASAEENPDLFWALRGGGGNFGVLTSLRYRVHPLTTVTSGLLLFPLAQAAAVLRGHAEILAEAPDELTVMAGFFAVPDAEPLVFLLPLWVGDPAAAEPWRARLASVGSPVAGEFTQVPYLQVASLFDDSIQNGRHTEMRTRWIPGHTTESIEVLTEAAARMTAPFSGLYLHHFHGAATRVPVADTAFGLRRDHLLVEIAASWAPGTEARAEAHRAWARSLSADLAALALPGGYANLMGPDESDRALTGFGANAERLLAVKRRFDPDAVFTGIPALPPPTR
ncbi:FAD-binding oxidoreductase [Kitasatospora sp. NBC_01287]|uniref:FAD-binding oxidoreductase n=1 Tax=Kitasatospora sp. NBC_01287 TaxID=2903573 RepID=UPI002254101C|nr:FAD-binding oxidoreductase [Kitasatospora sp. NBC_01287]MCX4746156.1 FAD-binding oxidoreductase [Kitasatospora sp. NBC_01287]